MDSKKIDRIMQLDREIDNISLQGTSYYEFKREQDLNKYDKMIIKYYDEILYLIIEVAREEHTKDIKVIDKKLTNWENTASQMLDSYISVLQFYRNFNKDATEVEIKALNDIRKNLKLDYELEMTNAVELADCYFHIGNENKARKIMLEFIKDNPDEDEAYQCMQNWYMYDRPDINKLAEVIDLAEKNEHTLYTDFGYDRLVKYYKTIGDVEKQNKYQELYDKWKNNIETIDF